MDFIEGRIYKCSNVYKEFDNRIRISVEKDSNGRVNGWGIEYFKELENTKFCKLLYE